MWFPGQIEEYAEPKKPSIVLVTLGRLIYDVLSRHMWLSIPTALVLGVAGKESLLTKYQRLAIWWVSIASYAIGTVGIVGSLRIYRNWQDHAGQGDLLGRDMYTTSELLGTGSGDVARCGKGRASPCFVHLPAILWRSQACLNSAL